ncbi:hypothetical protein Pyn_17568 [Prunus yedoensis var. nudiflora]|uniref:Uncharacterized protein n=1 Tax=Prunus yedoensis var. nudiflora TaxID=2094558 RepID=A0A314YAI0_PRUYE|nr:hypothetical protein Pyn_17568 [Prunus yedoensis var. nudiflora]
MKGEKDGEELWVILAVSGSLTVTLSKLCQSARTGEIGEMGKDSTKITGFACERGSLLSEGCGLICWVEETLFIAAGNGSSPRNPNGFFPIELGFPLSFFSSFLTYLMMAKSALPNPTKSKIFGSSMLLPPAASEESFHFHPSSFSSFFLFLWPNMMKERKWVRLLV